MRYLTGDPAGSSFPRIPQRAQELPRPLDVRGALLLTARALERSDPVEVQAVIGGLLAGLSVAEVLASLKDLAGR